MQKNQFLIFFLILTLLKKVIKRVIYTLYATWARKEVITSIRIIQEDHGTPPKYKGVTSKMRQLQGGNYVLSLERSYKFWLLPKHRSRNSEGLGFVPLKEILIQNHPPSFKVSFNTIWVKLLLPNIDSNKVSSWNY